MPTRTNSDVIRRWMQVAHESFEEGSLFQHPRFLYAPNTLLSRGGFPLVEAIYGRGGKKVRCFLLNGDLSDDPTNRSHQRYARWLLTEEQHLIVPFSALAAAGIDRSTIKPIEVRDDRWETIRHPVAPYSKEDITWKRRSDSSDYEYGVIQGRTDRIWFSRHLKDGVEWRFTAHVRGRAVQQDERGLYWPEQRHWLGDSVFRAKVNGRYRTFVSSFDYQERVPLYYLAEVPPGAQVKTVDDAVLALSPPIVHAAVAQQRAVKRQGDMFAIPTMLTTKDVRARTDGKQRRMQGVLGTDHVATESYVGKGRVTYARGFLHHKPVGRIRDHVICRLGKEWHLMVPNAVPRRRRGIQAARV